MHDVAASARGFDDLIQGVDWSAVAAAARRHDDTKFRSAVQHVLDDDPAFVGWQELTRALLSGDRSATTSPAPRVSPVVALFAAAERASPDEAAARRALVAVYVYFAVLALWELSDDHRALLAIVADLLQATARVHDDAAALVVHDGSDPRGYDAITAAVHRLGRSLEPAFAWETAIFCSCPVGLADAARDVRAVVEPEVSGTTGSPGRIEQLRDALPPGSDRWRLAELLCTEANAMLGFALLLEVVADAGDLFVDTLEDRSRAEADARSRFPGCTSVSEYLQWASEEVSRFAAPLEGTAYASAVSPYVRSLRGMADEIRRPTLAVDEGEIVLLYPFGLPRTRVDADVLVRDLVRRDVSPGSPAGQLLDGTLLGLPVSVREVATTNTFASLGGDALFGARLTFESHRLMLQTTAHTRIEDVDIDVRLGSLGNHYVRIACTTEHRTYASDDSPGLPDGVEWYAGEWTAHDIDQWVRRVGYEVGAETIWFESAGGQRTKTYDRLVEVAEAIVVELQGLLERPVADDEPARVNDIHANAQVVIVVERASARRADGSSAVALEPGDEFTSLVGHETLLMPQRGLPVTLEDWVLYERPAPTNLLDGIGRPGDLLAVAGDVSLLYALGSPSWATLEIQHLVEFAISGTGPLAAWSIVLRHTVAPALAELEHAHARDNLRDIRETSARVAQRLGQAWTMMDRLQAAQLMRSHRDRALLEAFMSAAGMEALQRSFTASIDATIAQRTYLTAHAERIVEDRQKRAHRLESMLLGVVALGGLVSVFAWYGTSWSIGKTDHRDWDIGVIVLVVLAFFAFRSARFASWCANRWRTVTDWWTARARHRRAERGGGS